MRKVFLTVDVECHDFARVNQYIWGKCRQGEAGLGRILELGKEHGIPINFFLDIPECLRYGDGYIEKIIGTIRGYGQPVELHLHPNFVTGDDARTFMWEYSADEQKRILETGAALYEKFIGKPPKAYRAGRYGVEKKTYDLIREVLPGTVDFSYGAGNGKMAKVTPEDFGAANARRKYRGVMCIPNSTFVAFDAFGIRKRIGVDAAEIRYPELKGFLKAARGNDFVLTMHSWHFIDKAFWDGKSVCLNKKYVRKFNRFVELLKKEGYEFVNIEDMDFGGLSEDGEPVDFDYNPSKGLGGLLFSLAMNFSRFQEIAKINKKYFAVYACFYGILFLAVALCAVLLLV